MYTVDCHDCLSMSAKAPAVRRMCQPEVQNLLEVIPWTITPTANDLLPGYQGCQTLQTRNQWIGPEFPTCNGMPKPKYADSQSLKPMKRQKGKMSLCSSLRSIGMSLWSLYILDASLAGPWQSRMFRACPLSQLPISARLTPQSRSLMGSSAATVLVLRRLCLCIVTACERLSQCIAAIKRQIAEVWLDLFWEWLATG